MTSNYTGFWNPFKRREIRRVGGRDLDEILEEERLHRASVRNSALVAIASLITAFAGLAFVRTHPPERAVANTSSEIIAIAPLENRTGDERMDPLGGEVADWVTQRLIQTRQLQVVPFSSVVGNGALNSGASLVASGSYTYDGDSLRYHVQLIDAKTRAVRRTVEPFAVSWRDGYAGINQIREAIVFALSRELNVRLSMWPINLPPAPSLDAHRAYASGLRMYARGLYENAAHDFADAYAADTTFTVARLWQARSLVEAGNNSEAVKVAATVDSARNTLTIYDRNMLDRTNGVATYSPYMSLGASTILVEMAPASDEARRYLAADALARNRPRDARTALRGILSPTPQDASTLSLAEHLIVYPRDDIKCARRRTKVGAEMVRCAQEMQAHGDKYFLDEAYRAIRFYESRHNPVVDRLEYPVALVMTYQAKRAYNAMLQLVQGDIPADLRSIALFRLAWCATAAGLRDQSVAYEVKALETAEDNPYVTLERARLAAVRGNRNEAVQLLGQALSDGLPYAEANRVPLHADFALRAIREEAKPFLR